jgi:hypothetical protein
VLPLSVRLRGGDTQRGQPGFHCQLLCGLRKPVDLVGFVTAASIGAMIRSWQGSARDKLNSRQARRRRPAAGMWPRRNRRWRGSCCRRWQTSSAGTTSSSPWSSLNIAPRPGSHRGPSRPAKHDIPTQRHRPWVAAGLTRVPRGVRNDRGLASADELPGVGDDETTFGVGRAFVRRVRGWNLWVLYRFDESRVYAMTTRGEPPVPVDD